MPSSFDVSELSPRAVLDLSQAPAEPEETMSALLASDSEEDRRVLNEVFFQNRWMLFGAGNVQAALRVVRENRIPVVISERDVPGGGWRKILSALQQLARPPLLVVTSSLADEYLWAEVLNLGGHDVLAKPFRTKELVWVLENAWRRFGFLREGTARPGCADRP